MKKTNDLTMREKQVLELVARNLSNNEIAKELYISLSTVKSHISSIIFKLNANGRVQATASAIKMGIISCE